jgi:hypothetical protein
MYMATGARASKFTVHEIMTPACCCFVFLQAAARCPDNHEPRCAPCDAAIFFFNLRRAAQGTRSSKLFGVRRFKDKVNGGQSNLASRPPPSDGDARDGAIWRVERPWGLSGA